MEDVLSGVTWVSGWLNPLGLFFFNLCQAFEFFLMSLKRVKLTLFLIRRKECGAGGQ